MAALIALAAPAELAAQLPLEAAAGLEISIEPELLEAPAAVTDTPVQPGSGSACTLGLTTGFCTTTADASDACGRRAFALPFPLFQPDELENCPAVHPVVRYVPIRFVASGQERLAGWMAQVGPDSTSPVRRGPRLLRGRVQVGSSDTRLSAILQCRDRPAFRAISDNPFCAAVAVYVEGNWMLPALVAASDTNPVSLRDGAEELTIQSVTALDLRRLLAAFNLQLRANAYSVIELNEARVIAERPARRNRRYNDWEYVEGRVDIEPLPLRGEGGAPDSTLYRFRFYVHHLRCPRPESNDDAWRLAPSERRRRTREDLLLMLSQAIGDLCPAAQWQGSRHAICS